MTKCDVQCEVFVHYRCTKLHSGELQGETERCIACAKVLVQLKYTGE